MNNPLDEVRKRLEASLRGNSFLKNFGASAAALALAAALPVVAANPTPLTSAVIDPAGDGVFPYDLYGAPVPICLDVTRASVTLTHGVFQFEIQVAADVPANAAPGFTPAVNHLGNTFGILTNRKTTGTPFKFFGQISYMQVSPKQPGDVLGNNGIIVSHGTWKFTSDNTAVLKYTLDIYPPSADADGDGLPDAGAQPMLSIPTLDKAKRVPIL